MQSGLLKEKLSIASSKGSGFERQLCAYSISDHREGHPRADEDAIASHEATAVVEGEKGTPELFDRAAVLAETIASGKAEHPDADDRENDQAGDPGVACDDVVLYARKKKAAKHWNQSGEEGCK